MVLRFAGVILCACFVCGGELWGQETSLDAKKERAGDVIELKYGKKLAGIQILRESPKVVEVQTVKDVPPLELPRGQISNIIYDDVDPYVTSHANAASQSSGNQEIMGGKELSPEFHEKLIAPLSKDPIAIEDLDLLKIIGEIQRLSNVDVLVDGSVRLIPRPETKRTFEIPAGTTLYSFLQNDFLKQYPQVTVEFRYDKVCINAKSAPAEN